MLANASGLNARCSAGRAVMGRPAGFHHNQADRAVGEPALELRTGKAMLFDDLPRASSATAIWNTLLAKSTATVVACISDSSRQTPATAPPLSDAVAAAPACPEASQPLFTNCSSAFGVLKTNTVRTSFTPAPMPTLACGTF